MTKQSAANRKPMPPVVTRGRIKVHVPMTPDWTLVFLAPTRQQRQDLALWQSAVQKRKPAPKESEVWDYMESYLLDLVIDWKEEGEERPEDMRAALKESGVLWGNQSLVLLEQLFLGLASLGQPRASGLGRAPSGQGDPGRPEAEARANGVPLA